MLSELQILVFILFLFSCTKQSFPTYSKVEAFEDLHQSISKYSASIDARNINWDSLGNVYNSLISEDLSESEYFEIIGQLLREFKDPHVVLISPNQSMFTKFLDYKKNYNDSLLNNNYLTDIKSYNSVIKSGFINDSIGYLACKDFQGDIHNNNQIYISALEKLKDTKGLIIDLRFNDGGSVYNAQNLLNKFTSGQILWHTTENRTLNGFDEPYAWFLFKDPNVHYDSKVILLTGRYTISAGERFAMGAKALSNITIVGDTTSNTQGSVMGREMLNGWEYRVTFEKCLSADGNNYAGLGIPPDIYIRAEEAIVSNQDLIMEKALELLR